MPQRMVDEAIAGDAAAIRAVVRALTPVIQTRAARALFRRGAGARGDVRLQLEDTVQDVLVHLFRDGGKALRAWDPERGLGLSGYVGMIADQHVGALLRARKRNPWSEDLQERAGEDEIAPSDDPEQRTVSRRELVRLLDRVDAELTPLGRELFRRLLVEEEPIAAVAESTGMSIAAVQAWSSRLKRLAARVAAEGEGRAAREQVDP